MSNPSKGKKYEKLILTIAALLASGLASAGEAGRTDSGKIVSITAHEGGVAFVIEGFNGKCNQWSGRANHTSGDLRRSNPNYNAMVSLVYSLQAQNKAVSLYCPEANNSEVKEITYR